ncbi:unnamed protein product [Fraxinus pennsylvanica]|uniref:Pyruvate dehydrogenase E1 component subunit beta n=1 Tax=Fraxinus pennsylvanica TaxID=56036 RepID=A0AAD2E241_9LAMI|nr:unnamed protein product [Fraxinus pennsylvanica]
MTVLEALNSALDEEMSAGRKVFLIGEEISKGLLEKYGPDRIVDTPITKAGFTGIGVGGTYYGLRPVIEFMIFNFSLQWTETWNSVHWTETCIAAHLTSAFAIYLGLFWTSLSVVMLEPPAESVAWVQGASKVKCMALPVRSVVR